jgi:hypothetical protein
MWGYLNYIFVAYVGWILCDFFTVPKNSPGKEPATNAQNVAKIYKEIENIKSRGQPAGNLVDKFKLKVSICLDTVRTIAEMKARISFNALFSKKIGNHILAIPYFHHDRWHYALVPSKTGANTILKITSEGIDVTEEILKYLGPDENFYGQSVTPSMLKYEELVIYVMGSDGLVSKKFSANEAVSLS